MPLFLIRKQRSFALIEMLVVIAIIGILAGIVLIAVPKIRQSAKDDRIINDLIQIQNRAEHIYLDEGNYGKVCPAGPPSCDPDITLLCNDAGKLNNPDQQDITFVKAGFPDSTSYCAQIQLSSGKWYCVDSALKSKLSDVQISCGFVGLHIQCL